MSNPCSVTIEKYVLRSHVKLSNKPLPRSLKLRKRRLEKVSPPSHLSSLIRYWPGESNQFFSIDAQTCLVVESLPLLYNSPTEIIVRFTKDNSDSEGTSMQSQENQLAESKWGNFQFQVEIKCLEKGARDEVAEPVVVKKTIKSINPWDLGNFKLQIVQTYRALYGMGREGDISNPWCICNHTPDLTIRYHHGLAHVECPSQKVAFWTFIENPMNETITKISQSGLVANSKEDLPYVILSTILPLMTGQVSKNLLISIIIKIWKATWDLLRFVLSQGRQLQPTTTTPTLDYLTTLTTTLSLLVQTILTPALSPSTWSLPTAQEFSTPLSLFRIWDRMVICPPSMKGHAEMCDRIQKEMMDRLLGTGEEWLAARVEERMDAVLESLSEFEEHRIYPISSLQKVERGEWWREVPQAVGAQEVIKSLVKVTVDLDSCKYKHVDAMKLVPRVRLDNDITKYLKQVGDGFIKMKLSEISWGKFDPQKQKVALLTKSSIDAIGNSPRVINTGPLLIISTSRDRVFMLELQCVRFAMALDMRRLGDEKQINLTEVCKFTGKHFYVGADYTSVAVLSKVEHNLPPSQWSVDVYDMVNDKSFLRVCNYSLGTLFPDELELINLPSRPRFFQINAYIGLLSKWVVIAICGETENEQILVWLLREGLSSSPVLKPFALVKDPLNGKRLFVNFDENNIAFEWLGWPALLQISSFGYKEINIRIVSVHPKNRQFCILQPWTNINYLLCSGMDKLKLSHLRAYWDRKKCQVVFLYYFDTKIDQSMPNDLMVLRGWLA
jgi:hypothetical protein